MLVPTESIILVAALAVVALCIVVGWLVRSLRANRQDEWNQGRRQVAKDFSSIWDDQQREFKQTVREFEHEINRRMVEAAQASREAGEPMLAEFDALMKKFKDANSSAPPPPPPLQEREVAGSTK